MVAEKQNVDLQRRKVIKTTGLLTAGGALASTSLPAFAKLTTGSATSTSDTADHSLYDKPLDQFTVEVKHRWESNDIALVIRNRGNTVATITHMTPTKIELARGTLDIGAALAKGPVTIGAGEELVVPLSHHRANAYNPQAIQNAGYFDRSLQRQLRERLSIVTDHNALAAVNISPGPRIG